MRGISTVWIFTKILCNVYTRAWRGIFTSHYDTAAFAHVRAKYNRSIVEPKPCCLIQMEPAVSQKRFQVNKNAHREAEKGMLRRGYAQD